MYSFFFVSVHDLTFVLALYTDVRVRVMYVCIWIRVASSGFCTAFPLDNLCSCDCYLSDGVISLREF